MKAIMATLIAALVVFGFAETATADEIVEKTSAEHLGEILKAEGHSYTVDSDGDLVWELNGVTTLIMITRDKQSITFSVGFQSDTANLKKVNEWNRTKRFSRSFIDDDGDPVLQLDLDFAGGVTRTRIVDFLQTCRQSLATWAAEVVQ